MQYRLWGLPAHIISEISDRISHRRAAFREEVQGKSRTRPPGDRDIPQSRITTHIVDPLDLKTYRFQGDAVLRRSGIRRQWSNQGPLGMKRWEHGVVLVSSR